MNNQLSTYFVEWRPELPRVCTRYEIRSPVFHLPAIKHKFAEHSLRYCLIKQLNREKCSILITSKVHTHSFQGYKTYLKNKAIDVYLVRHGRIGFGLMDKSQHSRSDNIMDDVLLLTYSSCYDSNSLLTIRFKYKFKFQFKL